MSDLKKALVRLASEHPDLRAELMPVLHQASEEDNDDEEDQARALLQSELEALPKRHALWKPPHNLLLNFALMGLNLWYFRVLPMFWQRNGYRTSRGTEGIVIHPSWESTGSGRAVGHMDMSGFFHLDMDIAEKLIRAVKSSKPIPVTVAEELKDLETHFGISIPSSIKSEIVRQSVAMAKRRWGVDRLKMRDRFIPLDGSKPWDLGSFE